VPPNRGLFPALRPSLVCTICLVVFFCVSLFFFSPFALKDWRSPLGFFAAVDEASPLVLVWGSAPKERHVSILCFPSSLFRRKTSNVLRPSRVRGSSGFLALGPPSPSFQRWHSELLERFRLNFFLPLFLILLSFPTPHFFNRFWSTHLATCLREFLLVASRFFFSESFLFRRLS